MHRELIARKLKESFEQIIDEHITTGLFTSGHREIDREYVLANVQILVKNENLHAFAPDAFDYIILLFTKRIMRVPKTIKRCRVISSQSFYWA